LILTCGVNRKQFSADSEPATWQALDVNTYLPWLAKRNCCSPDALAVKWLICHPIVTQAVDNTIVMKFIPTPTHTYRPGDARVPHTNQ
jgi:hypothetical protein